MHSQKSNKPELEKLDKELIILKQKCVDLETDRVSIAQFREENITRLQNKISHLEKENEELISQGETLNVEYENLLANKETNYDEVIDKEEKILEEQREKNSFLNSEIRKISEYCSQFDDPEFIYMTIANRDFYFLNKFLVTLNNHIHHTK